VGGGDVLPIMAYMEELLLKGYLFYAKGRKFMI